jgi:hypothetical protein
MTEEEINQFFLDNRTKSADTVNSIYNDPRYASTIFNTSVPLPQLEKNIQQSQGYMLEPAYNPTFRDKSSDYITSAFEYLKSKGIMDKSVREGKATSRDITEGFTGTEDSIGLVDATPIGSLFAAQEGQRKIMKAEPDALKRQMGLLSFMNKPFQTYLDRPELAEGAFDVATGATEAFGFGYLARPLYKKIEPFAKSLAKKLKGETSIVPTKEEVGVLPQVIANTANKQPSMAVTDPKVVDTALSKLAHKRVGTTGQYIGAPQGMNTPQKLGSLRTKIKDLAMGGKDGRFWYERSGKNILDAVGGDVNEADKIIQAIAITSPGTQVKTNFDFAIQAYSQYKAGNPIRTGRFPEAMSERLEKIFAGEDWGGRKTDDFYNNLMIHIDPSRTGPVTGDIWMLRAFGYKGDMPSEQQYKFITRETQKIADELGWEPHQVQASIWVATKARDEGIDISKAGFNYSDALNDNLGQISWESIPGATGNHMKEMFTAPYNVQVDFHVDTSKAILDENGSDIIAKKLGILSPGDFEAPGYFEGKVSPGTQTEFFAPKEYKGSKYGKIDPSTEQLINAYAITRGILLKQDGVGWHRPWFNPAKKDANGIQLDIGRQFSEGETKQLAEILKELSGHGEYNPISSKVGVRILNFDYLEFDNKEFTKLVQNAINKLELDDDVVVKSGLFNSQNGYVGNDWSVNKNGEEYTNAISGEGQSNLLRKVRDIIREIQPRIDDIDKDYSEKYGFTRNTELNNEYRSNQEPGLTAGASALSNQDIGALGSLPNDGT